jgi:hypothetical protein
LSNQNPEKSPKIRSHHVIVLSFAVRLKKTPSLGTRKKFRSAYGARKFAKCLLCCGTLGEKKLINGNGREKDHWAKVLKIQQCNKNVYKIKYWWFLFSIGTI